MTVMCYHVTFVDISFCSAVHSQASQAVHAMSVPKRFDLRQFALFNSALPALESFMHVCRLISDPTEDNSICSAVSKRPRSRRKSSSLGSWRKSSTRPQATTGSFYRKSAAVVAQAAAARAVVFTLFRAFHAGCAASLRLTEKKRNAS